MIFFKILLFLGKWGSEVRVLRDDGHPFQLIVGRPRRQSEATVPLVSMRGEPRCQRDDCRCAGYEMFFG